MEAPSHALSTHAGPASPDTSHESRQRRRRSHRHRHGTSGTAERERSTRHPADQGTSQGRHRRARSIVHSRPAAGEMIAMVAVASAIALGGGGTTNPLTETILQPLLAVLAGLPLILPRLRIGLSAPPRSTWILAFLVLIVPILQLIPLPPSLWQALPGRAAESASLALVHAGHAWMPWSMAPARTFISLLAMVGPVLVLLLAAGLDQAGRTWLCITIAAMGLVSIVLGVLQLSHADGFSWSLYPYYNNGKLDGFQANHNAQADVLGIALMAFAVGCTALHQSTSRPMLVWILAATGLTVAALALFLTGSRTGIALMPLPMLVSAAILLPTAHGIILRAKRRIIIGLGAAGLVLTGVGSLALARLPAIKAVFDRFNDLENTRAEIWTDTWHALGTVWPIGGGIGSFPVLFNAAERLEVVSPIQAGRAHNDWLEWALEAGLPGIFVLVLVLGLIGLLAWQAMRITAVSPRAFMKRHRASRQGTGNSLVARAQTLFACGTLLVLGAHALDDFPVRAMALACLAAVAVGLLTPPRLSAPETLSSPRH
ncbi:O-antigen ligase family protein [Novosphingobium pituita]|nr:O-antigen ligase family protein [Novosphingobium sp. IK01]